MREPVVDCQPSWQIANGPGQAGAGNGLSLQLSGLRRLDIAAEAARRPADHWDPIGRHVALKMILRLLVVIGPPPRPFHDEPFD